MDITTQGLMHQGLDAMAKSQVDNVLGSAKTQSPKNMQQIDETAKELESVFMAQMLSHMFASVETMRLLVAVKPKISTAA